ncbi:hypothetical protein BH10BAC4_BH10BAC4_06850 [soil metagenome]
MLRLTSLLILGLSCHGFGQTLTGQVYMLAEDFSADKCEAFAECDCCSGDIYFLSADKFCFVSRCISGDSYFMGSYSTKASKLRLAFGKKYVDEITDEEYNVTKLETKTKNTDPIELDIARCGQKIRLTHATIREWKNGSRYEQKDEALMMKELMTSKTWLQLSR